MASYNAFCHPLAKQAARESGATVIESENFVLGLIGKDTATLLDASDMGLNGQGQNFYQDDKAAKNGAQYVAEMVAPSSLKANWRIVRASSFQADEGPPQNAIDGNPETFWHSEYDPHEAKPPHEIVIDLAKDTWISGFKYLPRQDGGENGNVRSYEIYLGNSPELQTTLAAKGNFGRGFGQKIARFKATMKARYIRFVCLSEQNGGPYASAAELDIIRDPSKN
jgi:beta-galactosidase